MFKLSSPPRRSLPLAPPPPRLASPIALSSNTAIPFWQPRAAYNPLTSSTASHTPSPPNTLNLQLVNDSNQVGPGHDFLVRPFVCKYDSCDRAFARKSDLARHFRIHTNERPFVCVYRGCGKAFIQRSALTVHTRVHTGERPHHCETCNKAFADSSSLARHRRIHTGKRPYGCKVVGCGRQFARRNTYLKHFKRQHPELPAPTSSSVRALHIPTFRNQGYAGSVPGSATGSNDYATSPTGTPHPYSTTPNPSEGAYPYSNGGFVVGGMLHSSQLAPHQPLRPYFLPGQDPVHQGHPKSHEGQMAPNGLYDAAQGNLVNHEYTEQQVFTYPDNPMSRVQSNPVMGSNGFYFKHEPAMRPFQPVPNQMGMLPQGGWGGVGGGFNPSQIALPGQQYYQGGYQVKPEAGKDESAPEPNSPELVDMAQPKFQQHPQYQVVFNGVSPNLPGPAAINAPNGQLHSVPPQMQRFHSAPILPTTGNNGWPQNDLKATTPGYNDRASFQRSHPGWEEPTTHESEPEMDKDKQEWDQPPVYPAVPGLRVTSQFRYPSTASNTSANSGLQSVQTPQSLPPTNIFPQAYYPAGGPWPAKELNRAIYTQDEPPKITINRERQDSGVEDVGFGLAVVAFTDEASGEEDDKPWTPSDMGSGSGSGSGSEGEDEVDGEDDSDDEFVLGQKPKGKKRGLRKRVAV